MSLLNDKIKEWQNGDNYIVGIPRDSPFEMILMEFKPAGISIGDANLIMTGVKKRAEVRANAELEWEGFIRRKARFKGPDADVLNADSILMDLVKILEPVSAQVTSEKSEEGDNLYVTMVMRYAPYVGLKTKLLAMIKALEIMYDDVARRRESQLPADASSGPFLGVMLSAFA
jgi:hypothetical protein